MPDQPTDWPYAVSQFVCHQCGNCCRGDGYVELTDNDIDRAAEYLKLSRADFLGRYARYDKSRRRWHLIDQSDELKSCIFLKKNLCTINDAKPQQCKDFPYKWRPKNILDFCEGMRAAAGLTPPKRKTMSQ